MMAAIMGEGHNKQNGMKILNNVGKQIKEFKERQRIEIEEEALNIIATD
jgi:ATP phosphoribosyltransferase